MSRRLLDDYGGHVDTRTWWFACPDPMLIGRLAVLPLAVAVSRMRGTSRQRDAAAAGSVQRVSPRPARTFIAVTPLVLLAALVVAVALSYTAEGPEFFVHWTNPIDRGDDGDVFGKAILATRATTRPSKADGVIAREWSWDLSVEHGRFGLESIAEWPDGRAWSIDYSLVSDRDTGRIVNVWLRLADDRAGTRFGPWATAERSGLGVRRRVQEEVRTLTKAEGGRQWWYVVRANTHRWLSVHAVYPAGVLVGVRDSFGGVFGG